MSNRTSEANKAVRDAWTREQQLVSQGKGTRDWTPDEQRDILTKGKAYDEDGKAYEGHHMKSVEAYPEYQGEEGNIEFLSRDEHRAAHEGDYHNTTNGYYNPETGETESFSEDGYKPCETIELSEPLAMEEDETMDDLTEESGEATEAEQGETMDDLMEDEQGQTTEIDQGESMNEIYDASESDQSESNTGESVSNSNSSSEEVSQ